MPWEYLYDPDEKVHLATNAETAFVRYVPVKIPAWPTQVALPLRVLLVASNPHDMPALDVEAEVAIVPTALEPWVADGRLLLKVLEGATVVDVNQALRRFDPHVFHFVGHGLFVDDTAFLVFQDDENRAALVDEHRVQELFSGCKSTRLAIERVPVGCCVFSQTADGIGATPPAASGLGRHRHAARHCRRSSGHLRTRVLSKPDPGYPIEAAVAEGRRGIFLELGAAYRDWGTPVLFLRAKDGRLFAIQEASQAAIAIPAPPPRPLLPATDGFVGRSAELDSFAARLDADHMAVIVGMAGIGKTALAAVLAGEFAPQERIFWHSCRGNEGVADLVWQLAGFLATGRGDLWQMLQTNRLTGGKPLPVDTLIAYVIALLQGTRCLLCLDDLHLVDDDPDFQRLFAQLRQVLCSHDFFLLVTSRQTPTGVATDEFEPLDGLTETDARRLLSSRAVQLSDSQFSRLYRHTAGNAVFLVLAMNALRQRAPDELLENLAATDDIGRYLSRQVDDGLNGEERSVLEAVSVMLGYPATRDALEETLNVGRIVRAVRSLVEHHLLEERRRDRQTEYGVHAIFASTTTMSSSAHATVAASTSGLASIIGMWTTQQNVTACAPPSTSSAPGRLAKRRSWLSPTYGEWPTRAGFARWRSSSSGSPPLGWRRRCGWRSTWRAARRGGCWVTRQKPGRHSLRCSMGLKRMTPQTTARRCLCVSAGASGSSWSGPHPPRRKPGSNAAWRRPRQDRPLRASLLVQLGTVRFYLRIWRARCSPPGRSCPAVRRAESPALYRTA